MKKEEILAMSKKIGIDEGQEVIETDSFSYGLITVFALVLIFDGWKLINGLNSFEVPSIFAGYLATTRFYKFKKSQSKQFLIGGIVASLATIVGAIAFFMGK